MPSYVRRPGAAIGVCSLPLEVPLGLPMEPSESTPDMLYDMPATRRPAVFHAPLVERNATPTAYTAHQPTATRHPILADGIQAEKMVEHILGTVEDVSVECIVCFDAERTHALVPCGHLCVCKACVELILEQRGTCPLCRKVCAMAMRVYI